MGRRLRALLAFVYDFVIGDDWRIAAGVVAGLALTYAVSRTSIPAWWPLPVLLVIMLPVSLWLGIRRRASIATEDERRDSIASEDERR